MSLGASPWVGLSLLTVGCSLARRANWLSSNFFLMVANFTGTTMDFSEVSSRSSSVGTT